MNWYYAENGKQIGPFDEEAFRNLVSSGTIQPATLVWNSSMSEWKPASEVNAGPAPATSVTAAVGPPPAASGAAAYCAECGGHFSTEDMIQFGEAWVCANCKPRFTQKLREGVSLTGARNYGGFWIRAGAAFIDGLLVWIVLVAIRLSMGVSILTNSAVAAPLIIAEYVGAFLYNVLFTSKRGGTPGKLILGLRVVTIEGEYLSFGRAVGRYFANILSAFTLGIGYIMAAFDIEKRALHDRICNTRVIQK